MTIEVYIPGREQPLRLDEDQLYEGVDANGNYIVAVPDFSTKGFQTTDLTPDEYREQSRAYNTGEIKDAPLEDAQRYEQGDVLQMADGIILVAT